MYVCIHIYIYMYACMCVYIYIYIYKAVRHSLLSLQLPCAEPCSAMTG